MGNATAGKLKRFCDHDDQLTVCKVIHNELDYRLPISEGLAMFNVLQARGVPSKFLTFPDENHVSQAIYETWKIHIY